MDYGKYLYEQSKKEKAAKKKQHTVQLKEIRFRPKTEEHDYQFKLKHIRDFLGEGFKVKASVVFKGREITYKQKGEEMLAKLVERLKDHAKIDQPAHMEGRSMIMILTPERKKPPKAEGKGEGKGESKGEAKAEPKPESKPQAV